MKQMINWTRILTTPFFKHLFFYSVEKCWKVILNDEAKGQSHALLEGLTESFD